MDNIKVYSAYLGDKKGWRIGGYFETLEECEAWFMNLWRSEDMYGCIIISEVN